MAYVIVIGKKSRNKMRICKRIDALIAKRVKKIIYRVIFKIEPYGSGSACECWYNKLQYFHNLYVCVYGRAIIMIKVILMIKLSDFLTFRLFSTYRNHDCPKAYDFSAGNYTPYAIFVLFSIYSIYITAY